MKENLDNGYVVRLSADKPAPLGRTWYLPHHCTSVLTKFGVVFDCSAKFNGISLNDQLLPGPDLTNNLVGVLIRFKYEPIALEADIKSMLLQV